jgi:hypothetical protein
VLAPGELASTVERIASRELDPYTAAAALLARAVGDRSRLADREEKPLRS